MSGIVSVLLAILMLGVMIAVHEAGHFLAARLCGIEVRAFAIGFGPKIIGWTSKKTGTEFSWRIIPLGGFCAFYGQDDVKGQEQDDPRAFPKQKVWKRMITVLMGPVMNFVLAFLVLMGMFMTAPAYDYPYGVKCAPTIMSVVAGSPAEEAGLHAGDVVINMNGEDVQAGLEPGNSADALFSRMISDWKEGDAPLHLVVWHVKNGETERHELDVSPRWDDSYQTYMIGISWSPAVMTRAEDGTILRVQRRPTIKEVLGDSWEEFSYASTSILRALKDLVTTGEGFDQTGGPVAVISVVSEQVREYGMIQYFWMMCVISINLGIMNLLPIPGLDGSRFLFMVLEAIRRKPIPPQKEAVVHGIGMLLLFGLMIFFTFRDVLNLFH